MTEGQEFNPLDAVKLASLYASVKRLTDAAERIADALTIEGEASAFTRAERLEDVLETLVKACEASGITQITAGTSRPDLDRLRAIIDSAKVLLP